MPSATLAALAYELPSTVVDDAERAGQLGIELERVAAWSRGRSRHEAPNGQGPTVLAAAAARRALQQRGIEPADLDLIIFCTNTSDLYFPGGGVLLQSALGCDVIGSVDIRALCAGFLAGLDAARRCVMGGLSRRVLLASADVPSHINRMDGESVELSCLMGDGAAVALVEAAEELAPATGRVLADVFRADGSHQRDYWCEFPASRNDADGSLLGRNRLPSQAVAEGRHFPSVDLAALRGLALEKMPQVFEEAWDGAGKPRVAATIVAHLDPQVEEDVGQRLGARAGRIVRSDVLYSGGSSLPIALARARERGDVQAGDTVALVTSGAGASWGAALLELSA